MKIAVISFTQKGKNLADSIWKDWSSFEADFAFKHKEQGPQNLKEWVGKRFEEKTPIVFIGACGIAIRTIAPFVENKLNDSAVLVMDENGQFVIPILSGHVGGANELAEVIAKRCGAIPVITTATDVQRTFAIDLFAKENNLHIMNKEGIAKVSSKVLDGQMVDIVISSEKSELEKGILKLKPKEYVLGIGCKKGTNYDNLNSFIIEMLRQVGIEDSDILALTSVDLKKEESALIKWANSHRVPFYVYSPEELKRVPGEFEHSDFVEKQIGVDNVCERSAMAYAGEEGILILKKQRKNGMTIAIAKKKWKCEPEKWKGYRLDEE